MQSSEAKLTMSVSEAAKKLGIARNSLYEGIKRGEVPCIRIGKRILIPIAALEKKLSRITE
jgi:excisionase family DNA binding protein